MDRFNDQSKVPAIFCKFVFCRVCRIEYRGMVNVNNIKYNKASKNSSIQYPHQELLWVKRDRISCDGDQQLGVVLYWSLILKSGRIILIQNSVSSFNPQCI